MSENYTMERLELAWSNYVRAKKQLLHLSEKYLEQHKEGNSELILSKALDQTTEQNEK